MTDPSSNANAPVQPSISYGRRIRWLAAGLVMLIATLSVGWGLFAQSLVANTRTAFAEANIGCTDLQPFGYPFRMGIFCSKTSIRLGEGDQAALLEGLYLRTAAQVYNLSLMIAEVQKPVLVLADGRQIAMEEGTPRASIRADGALPARVSIDVPKPLLSGFPQPVRAGDIQAHFRKGPENRLDFAASALDFQAGNAPIAQYAFDASLAGTSRIEAALEAEGDQANNLRAALRGSEGEIRQLSLSFAADSIAEIKLSGPFALGTDGLISGDLTIAIKNGAALGPALTAFGEALGLQIAPIAMLVMGAGNGDTEIKVTIRDGNAAIGFIPLGSIPPL
jgi:hypothetical protein